MIRLSAHCSLPVLLVAFLFLVLPYQVNATPPAPYPAEGGLYVGLDPPPGKQPVGVSMAFKLHYLHAIDDEAETFSMSGALTLQWQDSRQAFDPAVEGVQEKVFSGNYQFNEISPGWFPQVMLANALGSPDSQGVAYRVSPDGTSTVVQQLNATVRSELQLHRFPFDEQELRLVFEVLGFNRDEVDLKIGPGAAIMAEDVPHVPEWRLSGIRVAPATGETRHEKATTGSTVMLLLDVERRSFFMVRLVLMPLALIVLLSWSVFWMERSSLGDRMAVTFVGILTAVAYQSMLSDIMPNIAYITFLNAFVSLSMVLMCATVLINLVVAACDKRGEAALGDRIDRACRWMFPLVYALLIGLASLLTFIML